MGGGGLRQQYSYHYLLVFPPALLRVPSSVFVFFCRRASAGLTDDCMFGRPGGRVVTHLPARICAASCCVAGRRAITAPPAVLLFRLLLFGVTSGVARPFLHVR